jgi:hypothetical protein
MIELALPAARALATAHMQAALKLELRKLRYAYRTRRSTPKRF